MPCNCLVGTPIELADGTCLCTGGVKSPNSSGWGPDGQDGGPYIYAAQSRTLSKMLANAQTPPPIVNNYYQLPAFLQATGQTPAGDGSEATIFGFRPIYVLGAAAIALWAFSAMGNPTKGR